MDKEIIIEKVKKIRVYGIFFWQRSGSYFVHSLLDSHPQIISVFGDDLCYTYIELYEQFENKISSLEIIEKFIQHPNSKGLFNPDIEHYHNISVKRIDPIVFKNHLIEISKHVDITNRRNFLIACSLAYYMSLNIDISDKNIFLLQLHNLSYLEKFYRDFPEASHICTYGSPVRRLNSYFRNDNDQLYTILHTIKPKRFGHLFFGWKQLQQKYKFSLFPLRIEELHKNPRETMQKVANFMDIKFEDSLLQSTVNGIPYKGTTSDLKSISGFNLKAVMSDDYKKRFSALDKFVLENLCSYHKEYVEYKTPFRIFCFLLYLLPMKCEWLVIKGIILAPKLGGRSRWDRLFYLIKGYIKRVYYGLKYAYAVLTYLK